MFSFLSFAEYEDMVPLSSFPLSYFIYEWIVRGETIFTAQREVLRCAVEVSRTLPVRLICFGHTHLPRLIPLAKEVTFVDTGTWAPISPTHMKGEVRPGYWNYVIASFEDGTWQVSYQSWMEKNIHE